MLSSGVLSIAPTQAAYGQDAETVDSDSYKSVRGSIYSNWLRRKEDHGYGARFKLQLTGSIYKFESFDDFEDPEILKLQSFGVRSQVHYEIPSRWKNVDWVPSAELMVARRFDTDRTLPAGSVTGAIRYEDAEERQAFSSVLGLKYGTRYEDDGLNIDDYLQLKLRVNLRRHLNWIIKESEATVTPFFSASYFLDELDIETSTGLDDKIDREYEIGLTFGTYPRLRLWKIKVPEIDISFTFGDDRYGFKIDF